MNGVAKLTLSLSWLFIFLSCSLLATPRVSVIEREVSKKVVLTGYVEAITEATVSAQISAQVKQIYVDVDDNVTAGTVLLELDNTELKAQLAKAKAELLVAQAQLQSQQSEFARLKRLSVDRFVSDNDMTKAQSAVDISQANIKVAKAQIAHVTQLLSYTKVIAPYSGAVTTRHVESGEMVQLGTPLLSGFALQQSRLTVDVPNALISQVEKNSSIEAQAVSGDWLTLTNLTIAPHIDKDTDSVMVRANINKTSLPQRPGSFIKVAVNLASKKRLYIPSTAVFYQGDLTAVYVQVGASVVLRQVIVGEIDAGQQEVISGLQKGDQVILDASRYLAKIAHTGIGL